MPPVGNYRNTKCGEEIRRFIPSERIKDRLIDRISFASDAGFYRLIPEAVVFPENEEEIRRLFSWCRIRKIPIVFRAGGTSLSGQSVTSGILCDISRHWKSCQPETEGQYVRVQPGITGATVNARMRPFGRKIGPDPSSISSAMMGGILSNNASGMCCGVQHNSYHTTRSIRFVLPDGKSYSTEQREDYSRFFTESENLAQTLVKLRSRILANAALSEKIRQKYRQKNTVGYALNAFLDYEHPLDIFARLLIGGEGTLAFISEAVMETIPEHPFKATSLLFFPDIRSACAAIEPLNAAGAAMAELMDRASLRAVENKAGMPESMKNLGPDAAALLIEFQAETEEELKNQLQIWNEKSTVLTMLEGGIFTRNAAAREQLWKIRKGLFPAVGAVRKSGTSVILEDLCFPLPLLGTAVQELQTLFRKHRYENAIIFGHARDGNLHFVITQSFDHPEEISRYEAFIDELVPMVLRLGGSLKAEHGTGRNMAPFVETEWGAEAYAIMKELKAAADPDNILNPGVILNTDSRAHLKDLKPLPQVEEEVDRCIECGFCEPLCPSRELSSSPRRRIVIRRAIREFEQSGNLRAAESLLQDQPYEVMDTCAVDGLCATACPVDINTGDLVKRLRRENSSVLENKVALELARHFAQTEKLVGTALRLGNAAGSFGKNVSSALRKFSKALPLLPEKMPSSPIRNQRTKNTVSPDYLYFPSCINRMMGSHSSGKGNVMDSFLNICEKTGIRLLEMKSEGLCCSQIFSSKGFSDARDFMAEKLLGEVWKASDEGRIPVICDVSSCTYTLRNLRPALSLSSQKKFDQLRFTDMVEVLHDRILPLLPPVPKVENLHLHPVCSLQKMGAAHKLLAVGKHFAEQVSEPLAGGCCGMAGDRGFLFPELTASSIKASGNPIAYKATIYSCTATCEMALANHYGTEAASVLLLIEKALEG